MAVLLESLQDAERVRVNVPSRDRMICARDNDRFGHEDRL